MKLKTLGLKLKISKSYETKRKGKPKEKANQIISNIFQITQSYKGIEKLALFMVDEIIEALPYNTIPQMIFWDEVKTEIVIS